MNNEWDDIKSQWSKAKEEMPAQTALKPSELIAAAEKRKKKTVAAHYANTLIMGATWLMLIGYFGYYTFRDLLSNIGIVLMVGGLGLRIVIEILSTIRSRKIHVSDAAVQSLEDTLSFYRFRKRIHGPVTFLIVALYIVGFLMLNPELSRHIKTQWLVAMDLAGTIAAVVLIRVIGKGVRQELRDLEKIVEFKRSLTE